MKKTEKLKIGIDSMCVYSRLRSVPPTARLRVLLERLDTEDFFRCYSDFFGELAAYGSLRECVCSLVLSDDNIFTRCAAAGKLDSLPASVLSAAENDLRILSEISALSAKDIKDCVSEEYRELAQQLPEWNVGDDIPPLSLEGDERRRFLDEYHRKNGYGIFSSSRAFSWQDDTLVPIKFTNTVRLEDLKNYDAQKKQVEENTLSFLENLPANNVLLYGDRGTGKSSTVHAVLNRYADRGLRIVEISKGDIGSLTRIRERLSECPMKFIIFIDDLSFDSHEDSFGELKAALEGSLSGTQGNILIYATSNRRHLIKESYSDRENDIHRSDTVQEEMSLSDRFGLSVYYENPDKKDYLDILAKIMSDRGIVVDSERLNSAAELWARRRGGRSPRCAKQFADYVEACEKRNINW